jgi:hypothetical protein
MAIFRVDPGVPFSDMPGSSKYLRVRLQDVNKLVLDEVGTEGWQMHGALQ